MPSAPCLATQMSENQANPFRRRSCPPTGTRSEAAIDSFRDYGFLWVRAYHDRFVNDNAQSSVSKLLQNQFQSHRHAYEKNWSVENVGDYEKEDELSADAVLKSPSLWSDSRRFYASTIIHKSDDSALDSILKEFADFSSEGTPGCPPILSDCPHDGGAWLFIGNAGRVQQRASSEVDQRARKRSRNDSSQNHLLGRAEHVDEVTHSGTWHLQLSGFKTWILRPNPEATQWQTSGPPCLDQDTPLAEMIHGSGDWRLVVRVEPGDLFVLNTKAWYHQTRLEATNPSNNQSSISLARDFFLPFKATEVFEKGDIILNEDDFPDGFDLPKSSDELVSNCIMAAVTNDDHEASFDDADSEDLEDIVLLATRRVEKGEQLILGISDDIELDEEHNGAESIDPRFFVLKDWNPGDTVLSGTHMPEEIPRSRDPNCRLVEVNGSFHFEAIKEILAGDVVTIEPSDSEDYEEIEADLGTGLIYR